MCVLIYDGDVEIQSPKQLEDHFPKITKMIPAEGYDNIIPESCLCQVDIENTLDSAGIKVWNALTDKDPLLAIKILNELIKSRNK